MMRIWKSIILVIATVIGLIAVVFAVLAAVIAAPVIAKLLRAEAPMPKYQQPRHARKPVTIDGEFHEMK